MKRTLQQPPVEQPPWRGQGGPPPQPRVEPKLEQQETKLHGSTTPKLKGSVAVQVEGVPGGVQIATRPRPSRGPGASSSSRAAEVIPDSEEEDESWGTWKK